MPTMRAEIYGSSTFAIRYVLRLKEHRYEVGRNICRVDGTLMVGKLENIHLLYPVVLDFLYTYSVFFF